ncbi:MAG: metallophosphoesterase [Candidatus Heimdallarchaeota archaeon]|nr:metallophosphoesterase [Candidatus Heimdallarchaeota archaeon]
MADPVRIIHFSDTHITPRQQFIRPNFDAAVNVINSTPHDFSIFAGDLTQDGLIEEFTLADELRRKIDSPKTYWIIGNHDSRSGGFEVWENKIGPREFHEFSDDVLFIGLDSCIPDQDGGRFGREALDYTKKILMKYGDARIKIVGFHHHILPIPKTGRERSNAIDAGDMLSVLLDHNVDAVFTGHKHHPNVYKVEDTIIVSAGSVSSYKTRSGGPRSLNYVEITPEKEVKTKIMETNGTLIRNEVKTITRRFRMVDSAGGKWLRLAQISGTDFGTSFDGHSELFTKGMDLIDSTNPDLILHCGNLTSKGRTSDYELAVENFVNYSDKLVFCPGPNDLKGFGETLSHKHFDTESIFEKNKSCFYILNTSVPETEIGVVGRTVQNRLERYVYHTRQETLDKFHTVVMHHHLIPIPGTRETSALEDAGDVLRLLTNTGVNLVLSGHLGKAFCTRVERTAFVNCNTLASQNTSSFENSFNLIDISADGAIVVSEINVPSGFRRILGIFPGILPDKNKMGSV